MKEKELILAINSFTFGSPSDYDGKYHSMQNLVFTDDDIQNRDDTITVANWIERMIKQCGNILKKNHDILEYYDENGNKKEEWISEFDSEPEITLVGFPGILIKESDYYECKKKSIYFEKNVIPEQEVRRLTEKTYKNKFPIKLLIHPKTFSGDKYEDLNEEGLDAKRDSIFGIVDIELLCKILNERGIDISFSNANYSELKRRHWELYDLWHEKHILTFEEFKEKSDKILAAAQARLKNLTNDQYLENLANTEMTCSVTVSKSFSKFLKDEMHQKQENNKPMDVNELIKKSLNVDELVNKSLNGDEEQKKWLITINCDVYGTGEDVYRNIKYNDEGFKEEGLPVVLILRKLLYDYEDSYYWMDEVFRDSEYDWLMYDIQTVTQMEVFRDNKKFDINYISDEDARKIVEDFLRGPMFEGCELSNDFIEKILDDIYPLKKESTEKKDITSSIDPSKTKFSTPKQEKFYEEYGEKIEKDEDEKSKEKDDEEELKEKDDDEELEENDDTVYLYTALKSQGRITKVEKNGIHYYDDNVGYHIMSYFPGINYSLCNEGQKVEERKLTPRIEYIYSDEKSKVILRTDYYGKDWYTMHFSSEIYPHSELRGILGKGIITEVLENNKGILIKLENGRMIACKIPLDYSKCFPGEEIEIKENFPYMKIGNQIIESTDEHFKDTLEKQI